MIMDVPGRGVAPDLQFTYEPEEPAPLPTIGIGAAK
jgi:hypothetical protein